MAGIVGITNHDSKDTVRKMLSRLSHRGSAGSKIIANDGATLGALWPDAQKVPTPRSLHHHAAWDAALPPLFDPNTLASARTPFAVAMATPAGLMLARDTLGIRPLYYGHTSDGTMCFASEVKALLEATRDVHEFPPGMWYQPSSGFRAFSRIESQASLAQDVDAISDGLRLRLENAVCRRIDNVDVMGSWLSGGLDSSAIVALARPHVNTLHTFAGGVAGAPDLIAARQVAEALNTTHHEVVVTLEDMLAALPQVIYHLESFDAPLVRSSVMNYLVAQRAAEHVGSIFSGEGADELFAGYAYLQEMRQDRLAPELLDITRQLHNTALQRVDRSAAAHGLVAHIPFLDLDVVQYAMRIPAELKLWRDEHAVEKWILRRSLEGTLPEAILWRQKAKFWHGSGLEDMLSDHAENVISDGEMGQAPPEGHVLRSKEEMMYYRIFRQQFGDLDDLSWVGRTGMIAP